MTANANAPESSPWLTVAEAAKRAQLGTQAIYYAIRTGKLKAARVGAQTLRIHVDWLDAWLAALVVVNPDAPGRPVGALSFPSTQRVDAPGEGPPPRRR